MQQAKAIIAQNLFEVGLVEHEDGGSDESDIVYYQDPASFDVRDQGMQIDIWASKKTPAEMSGKISQLNSIYRIKIDTTTPPPSYYEPPVYREPVAPRVSEPKPETPRTETPKQETPKSEVPKATTENKPKTTVEQKPKTSSATTPKTTTTTSPKPEEKPKAKKVIVE